jgi:nucleoside-diphosphate-sugar epimerase
LCGRGSGRRQPVHAADLAAACQAVLARPQPLSGVFELSGGETLGYRELLQRIRNQLGLRRPIVSVAPRLLRLALGVLPVRRGWNAAMLGRVNQDLVFDDQAARRELGWRPRGFLDCGGPLPPAPLVVSGPGGIAAPVARALVRAGVAAQAGAAPAGQDAAAVLLPARAGSGGLKRVVVRPGGGRKPVILSVPAIYGDCVPGAIADLVRRVESGRQVYCRRDRSIAVVSCDNLARAIAACLAAAPGPAGTAATEQGAPLVCDPQPFRERQLVEALGRALGRRPRLRSGWWRWPGTVSTGAVVSPWPLPAALEGVSRGEYALVPCREGMEQLVDAFLARQLAVSPYGPRQQRQAWAPWLSRRALLGNAAGANPARTVAGPT